MSSRARQASSKDNRKRDLKPCEKLYIPHVARVLRALSSFYYVANVQYVCGRHDLPRMSTWGVERERTRSCIALTIFCEQRQVMLGPDWPLGVDRLLQWLETTDFSLSSTP